MPISCHTVGRPNYLCSQAVGSAGATFKAKHIAYDATADAQHARKRHYAGPSAESLDGTRLIPEVAAFLDSQGVDAAIGAFVHKRVVAAEQGAYTNFLTDLKALAA